MSIQNDPDIVDLYIYPAAACHILGLGQSYLKELCWQHKLRTARVGGKTMLYREEVIAYREKNLPPPMPRKSDAVDPSRYGIPDNQVVE